MKTESAFPYRYEYPGEEECHAPRKPHREEHGLSKREYFAAKAMQAFIPNDRKFIPSEVAEWAVQCADALIKALNNPEQ